MRTPHPSVIFSNHSGRFSNFLTPNLLAMEQLACRGRCRHGGMHRRCSARAGCAAAYTAAGTRAERVTATCWACTTKILECASASRGHGQLPRDHLPVTACSSAVPCGYLPTLPRPKAVLLQLPACLLASAASLLLPHIRWSLAAPRRLRDRAAAPSAGCPAAAHHPSRPPQLAAPCAPGAVCHTAAPRAGPRRRFFLCGRRATTPNGPARRRSGEASHSPLAALPPLAASARERRSWTCCGSPA